MSQDKHIPALTLTEAVNNYMMLSFNETRKYLANYLAAAQWAWKDIVTDTVWQVQHKYVQVDRSSFPYTIPKPKGMTALLNVSVTDSCNNLQSLIDDKYMNILDKPKFKKPCAKHKDCGCEDALCDAIDSIAVRQKDVMIDGVAYIEKIWNKRYPNGDLYELRETPVKVYNADGSYTATMDFQETFICKLEVTSCGCVLPTPKNKSLIISACGCFLSDCILEECKTDIPVTKSKFGKFKMGDDGRIVVVTDEDFVIVSYKTNGQCAEEIIVDEVMLPALWAGIVFYTTAYNNGKGPREKQHAKQMFEAAKFELAENQNPIRSDEFVRIGQNFTQW